MRAGRFRSLLMALIVFAVLSLSSAAQAPRVPPGHDNLTARLVAFAPYFDSDANIGEATTQAGELLHACAANAEKSVWYQVAAPAGATLVVDTGMSSYDTVVSVWRAPTGEVLADLVNVDCENDGSAAALLKYPVTNAGIYYVSVSLVPPVLVTPILIMTIDLKAAGANVPHGLTPDDAIPLNLNRTTTVKNLEYGAAGNDVTGDPTCAAGTKQYPIWFKFTLNVGTILSFDTEGSLFMHTTLSNKDTALTLFAEGFTSAGDELGCDDDSGLNGAAYMTKLLSQPGTYYLRLTSDDRPLNAIRPSRYKVNTRVLSTENFVFNAAFEDNLSEPVGWTVKHGTGDGLEVGAGALSGNASFEFNGAPGEKSQLQQVITLATPLPVDDDNVLRMVIYHDSNLNGLPYSLSMTVTYTDGTTAKAKRNDMTVSTPVNTFFEVIPAGKKTIGKVKIAIKFTGTSGEWQVDSVQWTVYSLTKREGASPLPVPSPAN